MPLLTLFTAPKPFTNPHVDLIQRNALRSWQALGEDVSVVLVGDEAGMAQVAKEMHFLHLPQVACNALGTPLISSIFALARSVNDSPYLVYANADIILFPELLEVVPKVGAEMERFLMIGQRWDFEVTEPLKFDQGWVQPLRQRAHTQGKLHIRTGSDYFVYPRGCFQELPDFTVGRAGWDNWMIYQARLKGWAVVDATNALDVIHQSHDYSHLPNGQAHYRLPETGENIRLAGGRRTIFEIDDSTHAIIRGKIEPVPKSSRRFWREVEIFPLLKLHCYPLTQVLFVLFHPRKAWAEFWKNRAMKKTMQEA
ncbi:MAG: hypothetical protein ABFD05_00165 [Anaerolineaceae bacterium]